MTSPVQCSICKAYTLQLRQASGRGDSEQFEEIKSLYVEHLTQAHMVAPQPAQPELYKQLWPNAQVNP